MDEARAVRTAKEGRSCRHCSRPLPERPKSAKEHNFCPGTKCRSAWHREDKQRHLDAALAHVRSALATYESGDLFFAEEELLAAGAKGTP